MPLDIAQLPDPGLPFMVDFGAAGKLVGVWNPNRLTTHVLTQLNEVEPAQTVSAMCDLVTEWDLTKDGQPVPPSADHVTNQVPWVVARDVAQELKRQIVDQKIEPSDLTP